MGRERSRSGKAEPPFWLGSAEQVIEASVTAQRSIRQALDQAIAEVLSLNDNRVTHRRRTVRRLIDLSHPLEHGQLNFPSDPKISVVVHNTIQSIGYNITEISMSTHQGTHLDAPYHFFDDGKTLEQIPLERFYGAATLVDLAPGGSLPPKTPLTLKMFEPYSDLLRTGAKVIYRTGWDRMFGHPEFFSEFPTLTLDAARYLASRGIGLLGMDTPTPSVDWMECHHILLAKGVEIVIVEALANLDQLPRHFTFAGFPLKITGRDGSPIRAVAILDEDVD
jgi:kynurenine formamidase